MGRPLVAPATAFLSHAWAYPFEDVLAALLSRFEGDADGVYVWAGACPALRRFALAHSPSHSRAPSCLAPSFCRSSLQQTDIFVGSQHVAEDMPEEWWSTTFAGAIKAISHTLLLLQPWDAPLPLQRSWCNWELLCTLHAGARLDVIQAPAQEAAFRAALRDRFADVAFALSKVDTRRADASLPADEEMVYRAIHALDGGFEAADERIRDRLRDWLATYKARAQSRMSESGGADGYPVARRPRNSCPAIISKDHGTQLTEAANALRDQGRMAEAEPLYREALRCRRAELGDEHSDTLGAANALALALSDTGKNADALPLFQEVLRGRRELLGNTHSRTLTSMSNLAGLLCDMGRQSEAEPLYWEVLRGRRETLGDAHTGTLTAISNLAVLLCDQCKLSEAEPLFREALAGRRGTLGDTHARTLISISNLANVLRDQTKLEEAAPLLREALGGRRATLGSSHPDTLTSAHDLAALLYEQGNIVEPEQLFREALRGRRQLLGEGHRDTRASAAGLAALLEGDDATDDDLTP